MTDRRLAAVAVVIVAVTAVGTGMALGVFDGGPADDATDGTGPNESTVGDDPEVALVTGDDDRIQVVGTGGQTIRGTTDLPPGRAVEFRVTSTGPQPWARTETVNVSENGTFAAEIGLSLADWNETFQVEVVDAENGTRLANATGVVVADEYMSGSPAVALGRSSGSVIRVDAARNRSMRGKTDLPAGTELEVDFRSTGSNPFLEDFEATVDAEGTFGGTVDFGDVPANTSFITTVSYAENGTEIVDTPGVTVPPGMSHPRQRSETN
ncbi:BGTF surface domain-containing protein [Halorientalis pallida]|uniref:BGTF surface domain-containing protein n=1 Tax=Halorientalis pallida TaxID=2479928 RepID=UPI003C6EAB44